MFRIPQAFSEIVIRFADVRFYSIVQYSIILLFGAVLKISRKELY